MTRLSTRATQATAAVRQQLAGDAGEDVSERPVQVFVTMELWLESQLVLVRVVRGGKLWTALVRDGFEECEEE